MSKLRAISYYVGTFQVNDNSFVVIRLLAATSPNGEVMPLEICSNLMV